MKQILKNLLSLNPFVQVFYSNEELKEEYKQETENLS